MESWRNRSYLLDEDADSEEESLEIDDGETDDDLLEPDEEEGL